MYLEPLKERLLASRVASEDQLSGCSPREVNQLERDLGVKLPEAYSEFLRLMGKGAGRFLQGSDCLYPQLKGLQAAAAELLEENHFPRSLPDDAFVFFMHQGYQFSFFRLSEGQDPPTYSYCEGQLEPFFLESHRRFTEFLVTELEIHQKYSITPALP